MTEEFVFNCVGCGTELVGSKDLIGRSVRCYKCDAKQEVLRPKNSIKFNCISCGVNLATTECLVGTNVRCFHCNTKQKVPQNKKNEAKTYQRPKKKLRKVSAKNSKKLKAKSYNTVSKNKNILVSTLLLVVTLFLSFLFVKVFTKGSVAELEEKIDDFHVEKIPHRLSDFDKDFISKYCLECHNSEKQKGKINLEDLPLVVNKVEFAERWQEVLEVVNSGEMPPESELQPSSDEKMDLVANLSVTLMDARKLLADTDGEVTMRRLNRREYQNTIKELLGVTVEDSDLQSDRQENSFDTFGSSLYLSSDQISNYYVIGDKILKRAFDYAEMDLSLRKIRIDPEQGVNSLSDYGLKQLRDCQSRLKNWYNAVDTAIQKLPNSESIFELKEKSRLVKFYNNWNDYLGAPSPVEFGFKDTRHAEISALNGPLTYEHLLEQAYLPDRNNGAYIMPAPSPHLRVGFRIPEKWPEGDYTVNISAAALDLDDLKIDSNSSQDIRETPSKDRKFIDLVYGPENITLAGSYKVTGTIQSPSIISIPYKHRKVNVRGVVIRERGASDERDLIISNKTRKIDDLILKPAVWVDYIEVLGPNFTTQEINKFNQIKLWINRINKSDESLKIIVKEFTQEAYRGRSISNEFLEKLKTIYDQLRLRGESPKNSLRDIFTIILSSPSFLYISEKGEINKAKRLSDIELASRLSYFLWGRPPDNLLMSLAKKGILSDKKVLLEQTKRMLESNKINGFIEPFLDQWLHLDRLDFFQFNMHKHIDFHVSTKWAARKEIYKTFHYWLNKEGSSLSNLLYSDTIVINSLLADVYGIPKVNSNAFQAVKVSKDSPRGGFLGMAAISAMGSNGDTTSPIERGAWVLRKLMNDPPPPAPANIPQISRFGKKPLSTKEKIAMHQEEPQCASCHRKIDPIGLGMENLNASGKWRKLDDQDDIPGDKQIIDPRGKIYKGSQFEDFYELREIIHKQYQDAFARGFTENLLAYAIGKSVGFTDESLIRSIVSQAKENNYAISEFIYALVCSETFCTKK